MTPKRVGAEGQAIIVIFLSKDSCVWTGRAHPE